MDMKTRPDDPQRTGGSPLFSYANPARVKVTHDTAFQVSAVWACIDIIASALSSSDWNVYEGIRGADKTKLVPDDGLQYILNTRFNSEMSAQSGKRAMMIAAVGYGNGYAEIQRDMSNRIIGLWPIAPDRVEMWRDPDTWELVYRVYDNHGQPTAELLPRDVFHIRGPGVTGFAGDDVVLRGIQSISQAIAINEFGSAYFGNNAQLGTIFTYKNGKLDDAHYERLKQQIEARHKGSKNAFTAAFLDGGDWGVQQIGTDADKSRMVESRHAIIEDICRYFHVPPHKIQHLLRSTNNNIEHQGIEFSRDTLRPWKVEIEQEADYRLIPSRGVRKFVDIDLDWAEQGDYKGRAEALQIYRNMGVFNANDVLRKLKENTIGEEGDIRIVQGANVRLENVGAAYDTPSAQPAEPEDDDEPQESDEQNEVMVAWLTDVFARIDRRVKNRAKQLKSSGKPDWLEQAISTNEQYAIDSIEPMRALLGDKYDAAIYQSSAVRAGTLTPSDAARAVFKKEADYE